MRASRLNAYKDMAALALGGILIGLVLGVVMPRLQGKQILALQEQYYDEQRRIVARTVESAGERLHSLKVKLLAEEVEVGRAEALILSCLEKERFGVNGYGYFFAYGHDGTMLMHPIMPELVGRNIDEIESPDGVIVGRLFRRAIEGSDSGSGFVEYRWQPPGFKEPELKTTMLLKLDDPAWVIGSGFYDSDLRESIGKFSEVAERENAAMARAVALLMAVMIVVWAAMSLATGARIVEIERDLARQYLSLERYKLILDESSMVSRTDPEGTITYVNGAFSEVTGFAAEHAIGKNHNIERHPDTPLEAFRDLWGTIKSGRVWHGVIKNKKADGSSYIKKATIAPIFDERGDIVEFISSGQDITELVEKKRELEDAFLTDSLTGLGNRIHLLRDLERSASPCVALLDIEGFSGINRTFGTAAGDEVLKRMAEGVLDIALERGAAAYRINADTFGILLENAAERNIAECAEEMARRIKDIRVDLGGNSTAVITRMGVASEGRDCFLLADASLKKAKASRKMLQVWDPSDASSGNGTVENLSTLKALTEALEHDRIYAAYQPIVDVTSKEIVKYECLMRMEDSSGRIIMPDSFLEVSKKTDLYKRLTTRMIERSIEGFKRNDYQFSINLTVDDLLNEDTISYLVSEAIDTGTAERLIVEIIETEELRDFEGAVEVLGRLRSEGIRVAVDDFGSGYSSFEYLLKLNPEFIKIDRSIIQGLLADERAKTMLESIVGFAKSSGIKTIAEFIDSAALLDEMRRLGVDYAQGWLFGKAERRAPSPRNGSGSILKA